MGAYFGIFFLSSGQHFTPWGKGDKDNDGLPNYIDDCLLKIHTSNVFSSSLYVYKSCLQEKNSSK